MPIKVGLKSLPSNVFSHINLNIPVWVEWIDAGDKDNKVRFRERIFLRVVKEANLSNENIKKNIEGESEDIMGTCLQQMVDDLFQTGFIDECIDRLETHPETL